MARSIAHRELRNDSARILREVAAGESFEITNHGDTRLLDGARALGVATSSPT